MTTMLMGLILTGLVSKPMVSQTLPNTVVGACDRRVFETRRKHAVKVEKHMAEKGVKTPKQMCALLVNAWRESSWNPNNVSSERNGTKSIGLFQLNTGSDGRGHSWATLKNPDSHLTILTAKRSFKAWVAWCDKNPNKTAGAMALRFAQKVEVCTSADWGKRSRLADKWYAAYLKLDKTL